MVYARCLTGLFGKVALHPEGVDRNRIFRFDTHVIGTVALHPEGVDRNQ